MISEPQERRQHIDNIDNEITRLFTQRMALVSEMALYKRQNNLPILDTAREREIIARVTQKQSAQIAGYTKVLFNTIFDLSRSYQSMELPLDDAIISEIGTSLSQTPPLFPASAVVACQGLEGANSQLACERLFARPNIMYFNSFEAVLAAVDQGLCQYGILPIENSLQGSVNDVYDLMKKYKFYIARSVKINISHALLAPAGVKLANIREILSHEQALGQCSEFLKNLKNIKITPVENTAMAAKTVAAWHRDDVAAISSKACAELYGLEILSEDIQNHANNYTRFVCISKTMEIYAGANKISLMFTIPHRPGSLYGLISCFSALGVNMTKLESRPIPGSDFEFMFYLDLQASVLSDEILNLICQLAKTPQPFAFLGNYAEI